MIHPFGEWLPDKPEFANPGSLTALNVIPKGRDSYGPFPGLSAQTNALDSLVLGTISAKDSSGNVYVYGGTKSKLYESVSLTFTDESKSGGYDTADGDVWDATIYGQKVIFTNFTDPVQSLTIGGGSGADFADHITSTDKPKFKWIATVRDFLMGGFTNDGSILPNRVRWSALNNSVDFDESQKTLSDRQDMPDGGAIQRIVGGTEYGVIFQDTKIRRASFEGTPLIFRFDVIDPSRGTHVPLSIASWGRLNFFLCEEGFFYTDGQQSVPIGSEKVDRTFLNQFDPLNRHRVSAVIDPVNKLYVIGFPGEGNSAGAPNKVFVHHIPTGRWAEAEFDFEILTRTFTQGINVDSGIITDIDAAPWASVSVDSDIFKGGRLRFAAFDGDHKLSYFTGSNLAATLDTSELQLVPMVKAFIRSLRPLVDGGTPSIAVAGRNRLIDSASFGTAVEINTEGRCPVRNRARYQRARMTQPSGADWQHAQGLEIDFSPLGKR